MLPIRQNEKKVNKTQSKEATTQEIITKLEEGLKHLNSGDAVKTHQHLYRLTAAVIYLLQKMPPELKDEPTKDIAKTNIDPDELLENIPKNIGGI